MDATYPRRMQSAIDQCMAELPITGWYTATEDAALEHQVSLPELQRIVEAEIAAFAVA